MSTHVLHPRLKPVRSPSVRERDKPAVQVGKDLLELVTGAMYVNPLDIYREFIQNATDSLDCRAVTGQTFRPSIKILVDVQRRTVVVRDNGLGLANSNFPKIMLSVGASGKRGTNARGFRGVGRLAGLGYCRSLRFRSKGIDDQAVMQLSWDGQLFRKILRDPKYSGEIKEVVEQVTSLGSIDNDDSDTFFEVEMNGVIRLPNDLLLNVDAIQNYLAQIAPLPFHPSFAHGDEITDVLGRYGVHQGYETSIQEVGELESTPIQIYRPHRSTFESSQVDRITAVDFLEIPEIEEGVAAIGWFADHSYFGSIPKSSLISGLRIRVGNIQVGSDGILSDLFPEPRFNGWTVGEIHIVSRALVPNGRRDNFEESAHLQNLQSHLLPKLKEIARKCRLQSSIRQWNRRVDAAENSITEDLVRLENASLSKRQRGKLAKKVDEALLSLETMILSSKHDFAEGYLGRVERLRRRLNRKLNRNNSPKDPLRAVPYQKRLAFQEVLELVYEHSGNRVVANQLVDRITKGLSAKYERTD